MKGASPILFARLRLDRTFVQPSALDVRLESKNLRHVHLNQGGFRKQQVRGGMDSGDCWTVLCVVRNTVPTAPTCFKLWRALLSARILAAISSTRFLFITLTIRLLLCGLFVWTLFTACQFAGHHLVPVPIACTAALPERINVRCPANVMALSNSQEHV
jgi:hypothetical protein